MVDAWATCTETRKMAHDIFVFLLLLCFCPTAAVHRKSSLICNEKCSSQPDSECRLAVGPSSDVAALKCYDKETVGLAFRDGFNDRLCGPQGVVISETASGNPYRSNFDLAPLQCHNGRVCPADSACLTRPVDGGRYCCARVPEGRRCQEVSLYSQNGQRDKKVGEDDQGNPTFIVSMQIIANYEGSRPCIQDISYGSTTSTVYADQGCKARFWVCHESLGEGQLTSSAPDVTDCQKIALYSKANDVSRKTVYDASNQPVTIVGMVLLQEFSSGICVFRRTYSFAGSVVSASYGCRGIFKVCYAGTQTTISPFTDAPQLPGQACSNVNLFSRINRPAEKTATDSRENPATIRSMSILEQQPDSVVNCRRGESFSFSGSVARSTNGCRAIFRVCYDDDGALTAPPGQSCSRINLFSRINSPAEKTITDPNGNQVFITSMALIEQQPDSVVSCVEGRTFDYSGSQARSTSGCRGIFWICDDACKTITLRGTGKETVRRQFFQSNGDPSQIVSMDLVRQLSRYQCIEWYTFYFSGSVAVVRDGCFGVFRVCYERRIASTPAAFTEEPPVPGQKCIGVNLFSRLNRPASETITDDRGNPVTIRSMRVAIQRSDVPCVRGDNFGFSGSVAQSTQGCKARFRICYDDEGMFTSLPGQACSRVNLFSRINRPAEKTITDPKGNQVFITSIALIEQQPDSVVSCVEGRTFDYSGSQARSTGGCRGIFWVCYNDQQAVTTLNPFEPICKSIVLSSTENSEARRQVRDSNNNPKPVLTMDLQRQLSHRQCVEWYTFYFRGTYVVARDGCKGVFKVCYEGLPPTTMAPLTDEPEPGQKCVSVNLFSRLNRPAEQVITDSRGNRVDIRSMRLTQQHTKSPCIRGETFDFLRPVARSRNGCRGTFRVCFDDEGQFTGPPGQQCKNVNLFSRVNSPAEVTLTDASGNQARIQSMSLVEQQADSVVQCVRGQSFSFRGAVAQSTDGCRGVFRLCHSEEGAVTTRGPGGEVCRIVVLIGTGKETIKKQIRDSNNNPAQVISMDLVRQASGVRCVEWYNYYFRGSVLVVRHECFGRFKVCYEGPVATTPAALTDWPDPPGRKCIRVNLFSRLNRPASQTITDDKGNRVTIRSMAVAVQKSDVACVKRKNYGFSGSVAESRDGCRASFRICYDDEGGFTSEPGQECKNVNLFSRVNRPAEVTLTDANGNRVGITGMILIEQQPDSVVKCLRGQSFSFQGAVAQSSKGCRGVFRLCHASEGAMTTASPGGPVCKRIRLKSEPGSKDVERIVDDNNNPVQIISMEVVKYLSYVHCVEWYNFYFKGNVAVVADGCKAVFKVCYEPVPTSTQALSTRPPGPGQACVRVNLFSRLHKPAVETITDSRGNRVPIRSMTLVLQHTKTGCVRGRTYSFSGSVATSRLGCRGTFRICCDDTSAVTTAAPRNKGCVKVKIRSRPGKSQAVEIKDKKRRPVKVLSVTVFKQISKVPCKLQKTYYYSGSRVGAKGGCSAVFKVCYQKIG